MKPTVVDGGPAALAALEQAHAAGRPFALVLLDSMMPEMGGFEATGILRQREGPGRRMPVIAMTAHAMKGDRERCLEAGMDGYVTKPLRTQELIREMEAVLGPLTAAPAAPPA